MEDKSNNFLSGKRRGTGKRLTYLIAINDYFLSHTHT